MSTFETPRVRRWIGLAAAACLAAPRVLFAQEGATTVVVQDPGTNYIVETFLVLVLFGVALFAICKSSRRT
jgi:hypothetical protein